MCDAIATSAIIAALAALAPASARAQGVRYDLVLFVVQPSLDAQSRQVFERLGAFRPGIGADLGIGFDVRQFGATLSGGFAGIDVGEPIIRDGINMGREPGIYRSAAVVGRWHPRGSLAGWRPDVSVGYVRSGLDNVLLLGDSLPAFARGLGGQSPDTARRPVGIKGDGVRLGTGLQRPISAQDFSGIVVLSIQASLDAVRFREVSYNGQRMRIPDPGMSTIPRLSVSLRWSPGAPRAHAL